jgi:hypothetical protein
MIILEVLQRFRIGCRALAREAQGLPDRILRGNRMAASGHAGAKRNRDLQILTREQHAKDVYNSNDTPRVFPGSPREPFQRYFCDKFNGLLRFVEKFTEL